MRDNCVDSSDFNTSREQKGREKKECMRVEKGEEGMGRKRGGKRGEPRQSATLQNAQLSAGKAQQKSTT